MKIAIFQFSGTGNTWYVAKKLRDAFLTYDISCELYSLETSIDVNHIIDQADVIGLGYPIYGSNVPEPIRAFFHQLEQVESKRAFVFCTQMMYSGDGAAIGAKALRKKGFTVRQLMHVNMPNNITDFRIVRWVKPTNAMRLTKRVTRKTKRLSEAVVQNRRKRKGEGIGSLLLGLLQRIPVKLFASKASNLIRVDATCTACGLCVRLCPSHHLTLHDKQLRMGNNCYLCYRCINHCPVQALHVAKRTRVKRPYLGPVHDFTIEAVRRNLTK